MLALAQHFSKATIVIQTLFSKKGLAMLPFLITMPIILNTTQKAIGFLIILMICDFATGVGASISKERKYRKSNPNLPKRRIISSEKLRRSGVKFLLYSMTILTSFGLQIIFQLKTFSLSVSNLELTLTIGVIAFWCIVEFYSIFFENFKEMGIDIKLIVKKITSLITFFKEKANDVCGDGDNKKEEQ
jgi:hypothetical protein